MQDDKAHSVHYKRSAAAEKRANPMAANVRGTLAEAPDWAAVGAFEFATMSAPTAGSIYFL